MCHCMNWQTQLAVVIPAHSDYFLLRMLRRKKLCGGKQGEDDIHADEPCCTLAQSQLRAVVQQTLPKMPVLWDVRNQGLLSSIAFWLHTYCMEIGFPPQFGPQCRNEIYFRAIWFHFFHICVYDMNSGRTTAFVKKVSKSIFFLTISY